jgi:hypothetical protein
VLTPELLRQPELLTEHELRRQERLGLSSVPTPAAYFHGHRIPDLPRGSSH